MQKRNRLPPQHFTSANLLIALAIFYVNAVCVSKSGTSLVSDYNLGI